MSFASIFSFRCAAIAEKSYFALGFSFMGFAGAYFLPYSAHRRLAASAPRSTSSQITSHASR